MPWLSLGLCLEDYILFYNVIFIRRINSDDSNNKILRKKKDHGESPLTDDDYVD